MNRSIYILIILLATALCCQGGTGLLQEYKRTGEVTLYDYYFHSCRASLVLGVDSTGVETPVLALTLEDDDFTMGWGDEVSFRMKDGSLVTLKCADDLRRGDVHWRRFKNGKIRYVTHYYYLQWEQLERLKEMECRTLVLKTRVHETKRNLKDVKSKFAKLYSDLTAK